MVVILLLTPSNRNPSNISNQSSIYYAPAIYKDFITTSSTLAARVSPPFTTYNDTNDISTINPASSGNTAIRITYDCSKHKNLQLQTPQTLQSSPPPSPLPSYYYYNHPQQYYDINQHKPNYQSSQIYSHKAVPAHLSSLCNKNYSKWKTFLSDSNRLPSHLSKSKQPYDSFSSTSLYKLDENAELDQRAANYMLKSPRFKYKAQTKAHSQTQRPIHDQKQFAAPIMFQIHTHPTASISTTTTAKNSISGTTVPVDPTISAVTTAADGYGNFTNITDFVRHVTRVNFYDIDTSQVEFEPKDNADKDDNTILCDTEAITKEEEWITKRNTEVRTTRQVETRVQRQVVLEDDKVIGDSGLIISTNTTEDTDKQETETTEKHDLGIADDKDIVDNVIAGAAIKSSTNKDNISKANMTAKLLESKGLTKQQLKIGDSSNGKLIKRTIPHPSDGLVHSIDDNRVVSHNKIEGYLETEEVKHLGDFADEVYVNAINSSVENLQEVLLTSTNGNQQQPKQSLAPLTPCIIANTSKSFKTIDSESTQKWSLAKQDGTLITETKTTTDYEEIVSDELSKKDDPSIDNNEEITIKEVAQRNSMQREEQCIDLIADGKVVGTEMRYAAETMQIDKDCSLERPSEWDSLSDRMRKLRRPQQKPTIQQQQKASLLADRKDALTKRPLDFDREEETRKGETMKWLESHFGSESTASNDSHEDDLSPIGTVDPTKKTFFNVTIKSNLSQNQLQPLNPRCVPTTVSIDIVNSCEGSKYATKEQNEISPTHIMGVQDSSKYYHGVSNWSDRKEAPLLSPVNHFSSKAFRDDLQETIKRNDLKKSDGDKGGLSSNSTANLGNDNYVSREDILQQKRQSLASQFLAKTLCESRESLNDLDVKLIPRNLQHFSGGSRADFRNSCVSIADVSKKEENSNTRNNHVRSTTENNTLSENRKETCNIQQPEGFGSGYNAKMSTHQKIFEGRAKSDRELDVKYEMEFPRFDAKMRPREIIQMDSSKEISQTKQSTGSSTLGRPTVPQRRRVGEKKLHEKNQVKPTTNFLNRHQHPYHNEHEFVEPPPDYSPPPHSFSPSPQLEYFNRTREKLSTSNIVVDSLHGSSASGEDVEGSSYVSNITSTSLIRKQNRRTRFAPMTPATTTNYVQTKNIAGSHQQIYSTLRSSIPTHTVPLSALSSTTSQKSNKVGQIIGNSLRKLVSKIRSASVERKFRMKSKNKSREQSPSTQPHCEDIGHEKQTSSVTYQQYNIIDGHIKGRVNQGGNNELDQSSSNQEIINLKKIENSLYNNTNNIDHGTQKTCKVVESGDHYKHNHDGDPISNPRQRYYLGEDPYSSSLYGKENIYDPNMIGSSRANPIRIVNSGNGVLDSSPSQKQHIEKAEHEFNNSKVMSIYTLGRYQKSRQVSNSTPNLHQDFRIVQTLPRKLHENNQQKQLKTQSNRYAKRYNLGAGGNHTLEHYDKPNALLTSCVPSASNFQQQQSQYVGPMKPVRTFAKILNRSKSFNVHSMNGSNNPSLIYLEKLTKNNYNTTEVCNRNHNDEYNHMSSIGGGTNRNSNSLHASQAFKSNPHLFSLHTENILQSSLKSPSIVNLISRSQKDLSKIGICKESANDDGRAERIDPKDNYQQQELESNHQLIPADIMFQSGILRDKKKHLVLNNNQISPNLFQSLHGSDSNNSNVCKTNTKDQLQPKYSFELCSSMEINKDRSSIIRRDFSSNNDFDKNNKREHIYKDGHLRRGSESIIENRK